MKNKKRTCRECPECKLDPKNSCFWEIEQAVPEHFKPSKIKAYIALEALNGMHYLNVSEWESPFDPEFLSWLLSYCVANKINVFWKTKDIPFCLGTKEFIETIAMAINKQMVTA